MKRFRTSRLFVATLVASFIGTLAAVGYVAVQSQAAMHAVGVDLTQPGPIGGTTPNSGAFTTLTANNLFTLTGVEDSLTAFAGGGQGSATALSATKNYHRVTTVATAADSVKLPTATAGQMHYLRNDGANAMQVFGQATETINGAASATGISQGVGMGVWYVCITAGAWTSGAVSTITATTAFSAPVGSVNPPGIFFTGDGTTGWYRRAANTWTWSNQGTGAFEFNGTQFSIISTGTLGWLSGGISTAADLTFLRDAADTSAQKRGTNAQMNRLYFSTTGPVYWQQTARTAGVLYTAVGGAAQVSYAQTTVPTITTNGGTSPACVGTDTAMICTEGTSPPAAATFTVTFNGTWPAAPSCVALRGTAGASPLVQNVVTTTTTAQVNLSANLVASEKYHIHCYGIS